MDNVDLSQLVEESSEELIADKRKRAASIIKAHLQRIEGLALDVRNAERELNKKKEKLEKAQQKLNKIKEGDWSLLSDKKDGPSGHNQGSEVENRRGGDSQRV